MKLAVPAAILISTGALSSRGVSGEACFVHQEAEKGRNQLQESYALGQVGKGTFYELLQIAQEREIANWDGYGADAVPYEAYLSACLFLDALPLGTPAPTIGAEPDGDITFEWYHSTRRVLSVSISANCELNYAALLPGPRKATGTEQFVGDVPASILNLISDVVSAPVVTGTPGVA
jgi:hypothetical protein